MNKLYSVNFLIKGRIWETRNFWSNEEAMKFIQGHWHHSFWKFKVVEDNDIHKIWYAV